MPTYEYECKKCRKRFERLQSLKEKPVKRCPSCGGSVHRLMGSGVGLVFKGSGFYVNDYKGKGGKPSGSTASEKSSSSSSSSGGKA